MNKRWLLVYTLSLTAVLLTACTQTGNPSASGIGVVPSPSNNAGSKTISLGSFTIPTPTPVPTQPPPSPTPQPSFTDYNPQQCTTDQDDIICVAYDNYSRSAMDALHPNNTDFLQFGQDDYYDYVHNVCIKDLCNSTCDATELTCGANMQYSNNLPIILPNGN